MNQITSQYFVSDGAGSVRLETGTVQRDENQLLLRTVLAGVNRGDVLGLTGAYGEPTGAGQRVGQDIVGVVESAHPGDAELIGTTVFGQITGAWGQHAVAARDAVVPLDGLDAETAATLPLAGFTALRLARQAERTLGTLSDERVLITGGTGAVGSLLVALLVDRGAQVWLPTRRDDLPDRPGVHQIGSIAEAPEVGAAFESLGGTYLPAALRRLRPHGHAWWFGEATRRPATVDFFSYLGQSPWHLHHFAHWVHDGRDADDLAELRRLFSRGVITVPRHRVITPDQLADSLSGIAHDTVHEKIVVRF